MAPRTRKIAAATAETAEGGVKEILATSVEKTFEEAATYVNVSNFKLRDMFCDRLGTDEPNAWETIPTEHEPLLEEFKRQMDAAATVKPHLPPVSEVEQPPLLENESEPPKEVEKGGEMTSKRKTSGITNKRKKSIGKQLANIETIDLGIDNAEALNLVRDAAADGVELGQAQVLAKESARLSVRRKAYERTTAKLKEKAIKRAEYDPTDLLKQAGLQVSDELLKDLQEFSEVSLGKLQTVFEEVTEDVWGNGYTNDFSELDTLLDWSE